MAVPATTPAPPRWQLRFESPRSFNQDLDAVASAFTAPDTRRAWERDPARAADYALQRVLTAFRLNDMLALPMEVVAAPLDRGLARYTVVSDRAPEGGTPEGTSAREIVMTVAGDPEQDSALLSALLAARGEATDLVVFLDRDGVAGDPGDRLPVLSGKDALMANLKTPPEVGLHLVTPQQARLFATTNQEMHVGLEASYATDFAGWIAAQVVRLEQTRLPGLDAVDLAEELGDVGKSTKFAIQSHLCNLLMHLLKWRYQPAHRSGSWRGSIGNARQQISKNLSDSPSLKRHMPEWFAKEYGSARELAGYETELPIETFPETRPFSLDQALDETFLPDNRPPHAE